MKSEVKVKIGEMLLDIGVDEVEAGFPAANPNDSLVIKSLSERYGKNRVIGFGRAVRGDIDAIVDSGAPAANIFIPSSKIQIRHLMRGKSIQEVAKRLKDAVSYAQELGLRVEVSLSDSTRAGEKNLKVLLKASVEAGASRVVLADTVGVATPKTIRSLVKYALSVGVKSLGVHLHNDLGLALGNALAAVEAGVKEVQVTVGGIGERTGNTALEEVALIQAVSRSFVTGLRLESVGPTVLAALKSLNYTPCPNKPVIGRNAFTHTTDLHITAVFQEPEVFEPINPEVIGLKRRILLSHLLGKRSLQMLLNKMGLEADEHTVAKLLEHIKSLTISLKKPLELEELPKLYRELSGKR